MKPKTKKKNPYHVGTRREGGQIKLKMVCHLSPTKIQTKIFSRLMAAAEVKDFISFLFFLQLVFPKIDRAREIGTDLCLDDDFGAFNI